jgi:23S rRNA (uracil1939-C5)-methyltransferase
MTCVGGRCVEVLKILRLSHEGRGIANDVTGKTVFVDGVFVDEVANCEIVRVKKRFNEARAIEITTAHPARQIAACPHFLTCGGCSLQHQQPSFQLEHKLKTLLEQLQHFGNVEPQQIMPSLTGPIWHYRYKARLGVKYVFKKDKVLVGFRERQSAYLADIDSCAVLHAKVSAMLPSLKATIYTLDAREKIAQIEVAAGDKDIALVFRNLEELSARDLEILREHAKQHEYQLFLQPAGNDSVYKVDESSDKLYFAHDKFGIKIEFKPLDFTQVNPQINRKMMAQAIDWLKPNSNDTILDLFCGLGNFSLPFAKFANKVVGVEGSAEMVMRAGANANLNNIGNVAFYAADLTKEQNELWTSQKFNKIIIDPPRTGAKEILPLINKLAPQQILYVSCNPATFARDSGILVNEYGYKLAKVGLMDMFCHTNHVEVMALFTNG